MKPLDHTASDFTPATLRELSRVFFHEAEGATMIGNAPPCDEELREADRLLEIAGALRVRAGRK